MKVAKINDSYAMEADCLLTAIIYNRVKVSETKWNVLSERIEYLKTLIIRK